VHLSSRAASGGANGSGDHVAVRVLKAVLAAFALFLIPVSGVFAQADAPIPMPRPLDRMPEGMEVPDTPGDGTTRAIAPQTAAQAAELVVTTPQPVTLTAQITEGGAAIPEGLVWRIFDTRTDTSGELALAAKSDEATATINLAPGEYVVHVAYGRAQASDTLTVAPGQNLKSIILDAGALRLNAAVTGDVPIPINLLRFDIYSGDNESDAVAEGLSANDIVTLNAGIYHVVSHFGAINAVVRADLRVEPGQMTDATLYHRAAQISFKLVSEPGGEAIADIEWTVKSAGGETVFTNLGAFPVTVLQEGDYTVLAKRGDDVFNRDFQVQPGPSREIEVLTAVY
jgi:hypothetical protein